jgi:hypothetical protein
MATVRHLGLFPRNFLCPSENFFGQEIPRQYPDIWLPPEYALAMYWRVKKWRFSYAIEWQEVSAQFFQYSSSAEFFAGQYREFIQSQNVISLDPRVNGPIFTLTDYTFGEPPETEKKLVCGLDLIEGEVLVEQDFEEPFLEPVTFEDHFNCQLGAQTIQPNPPGGGTRTSAEITYRYGLQPAFYRMGPTGLEFRPRINFFAGTFRWTQIYAASWSGTSQDPLGTYGTFSYKLLGETFSTDIYAYNSRSTVSGFANNLNIIADLEAIEYWPYDPNDGLGPIYDSTTGEQLRPFPA